MVSSVLSKHLQGTLPQQIPLLVDLTYGPVRPLDTAAHHRGQRKDIYSISDLDVCCVCEPAFMVMTLCSYGYSEYSRLESQKPLYNV